MKAWLHFSRDPWKMGSSFTHGKTKHNTHTPFPHWPQALWRDQKKVWVEKLLFFSPWIPLFFEIQMKIIRAIPQKQRETHEKQRSNSKEEKTGSLCFSVFITKHENAKVSPQVVHWSVTVWRVHGRDRRKGCLGKGTDQLFVCKRYFRQCAVQVYQQHPIHLRCSPNHVLSEWQLSYSTAGSSASTTSRKATAY